MCTKSLGDFNEYGAKLVVKANNMSAPPSLPSLVASIPSCNFVRRSVCNNSVDSKLIIGLVVLAMPEEVWKYLLCLVSVLV